MIRSLGRLEARCVRLYRGWAALCKDRCERRRSRAHLFAAAAAAQMLRIFHCGRRRSRGRRQQAHRGMDARL